VVTIALNLLFIVETGRRLKLHGSSSGGIGGGGGGSLAALRLLTPPSLRSLSIQVLSSQSRVAIVVDGATVRKKQLKSFVILI